MMPQLVLLRAQQTWYARTKPTRTHLAELWCHDVHAPTTRPHLNIIGLHLRWFCAFLQCAQPHTAHPQAMGSVQPALPATLLCGTLKPSRRGFSEAQFGHLFARGDTRDAAIRAMVVALKEVKIRGEIRTIVDYVVDMVQAPEFIGNRIHTGWLDSRIAAQACTFSSSTLVMLQHHG